MYQLPKGEQKITHTSLFEAHFGRRADTPLRILPSHLNILIEVMIEY